MFVLSRRSTTRFDLERFRMKEKDEDNNITLAQLEGGIELARDGLVLSRLGNVMKESTAKSTTDDTDNTCLNDDDVTDMRKDWVDCLDKILNDERVTTKMMSELDRGIKDAISNCWEKVEGKWGQNGGGEGKMEFCGQTSAFGKERKRFRGSM